MAIRVKAVETLVKFSKTDPSEVVKQVKSSDNRTVEDPENESGTSDNGGTSGGGLFLQ